MFVQCRDILNLPSMKKATLVAGGSGLNRFLRWVHILEFLDVMSWADSGDLLLLSGRGMNDHCNDLIGYIRDMDAKGLAGLVVAVGSYIKEIPREVIDVADVLNFPIFTLPWEVRFVDVTREVGNYIVKQEWEEQSVSHLLESILFDEGGHYDVLAKRAAYCGYDLSTPHQIMILHATGTKESACDNKQGDKDVFNDIEQCIRVVLCRHNKQGPLVVRGSTIIVLIPVILEGRAAFLNIKEMAGEMIGIVKQKYPGVAVFVGIGSCCTSLSAIQLSFEHAAHALEHAHLSGEEENICVYGQMGVYRLLMSLQHREVLTSFCRDYAELLWQYDKVQGSNLINNTLIYLEENGNVVKAAKRLYLHRNTLLYRLQKVQEITGLNLECAHDRLSLHIALLAEVLFRNTVQK